MKLRKTLALLPLALTAGIVTAGDEETVKYRENVMKIIGGHMGAIVAIVKGEVPYSSELVYHADSLTAAAPKALPAFKTEAMTEDSHALPEIWKDWATFEKSAQDMEAATKDLAAAVAGGDQAAIGAALGKVGESCKGCHDNFTEEQ